MAHEKNGNWHYRYRRIPDGVWLTKSVGRDKLSAEVLEAEARKKWARFQAGLYDEIEEVLADEVRPHAREFIESLQIKRRSSEYVSICESRLNTMLEHARVRRVGDLRSVRPERILMDLTRGDVKSAGTGRLLRPASPKTAQDYGVLLRQFGEWMARNRRLPTNPWAGFVPTSSRGQETRSRIKLRLPQIQALAVAAEERGARDRATLYLVAAFTGLRRNELVHLRWGQLHLADARPWLQVDATKAKNRRSLPLPLIPDLAERLLAERRAQAQHNCRVNHPEDRVFPWLEGTLRGLPALLREDAEHAGLPVSASDGSVLDFHSLRGSCATILMCDLGVKPILVQQIMRHADLQTTMRHYVGLTDDDMFDAVKGIRLNPSEERGAEGGA